MKTSTWCLDLLSAIPELTRNLRKPADRVSTHYPLLATRYWGRGFAALSLLGFVATCAAAPTVANLRIDSVVLGGNATLHADVTDPGGTLVSATFYVSGPAARNAQNLGAITWPAAAQVGVVNLSGTQGSPQITWQPSQVGTYSVSVYVADQAATSIQSGTFECVSGRLVVPPVTIASGYSTMFRNDGEIVTTENDSSPSVVAQSGGNLVLWSGGRVVLKPGFRASNGAFFWAAVDHNGNGYSDVEEATCTAGDGIPDAWKIDHGLNIAVAYPQYLAAYLGGYSPTDPAAANTNPSSSTFQLVLRTPSNGYYGVNTSNWTITGL